MKKKFLPALLAALGFVSITSSCGKDDEADCYRCSYTYSYQGQTYTDVYTYCEEDFGSRDLFEAYIDYLKSEGYDCDKVN